MDYTPFPARPVDVVTLACSEFLVDLKTNDDPSLDVVCRRFANDINRALVWLIRFRALRAWSARPEMAEWLSASTAIPRDLWEVAARFELNDRWEFDVEGFRSAVNRVTRQRSGITSR